jgi:hypothetical protein
MQVNINEWAGGFDLKFIPENSKDICQLVRLSINTLVNQSFKLNTAFYKDGHISGYCNLNVKQDIRSTIK